MEVRGQGEDRKEHSLWVLSRSDLNPRRSLTVSGDTMAHRSVSAQVAATGISRARCSEHPAVLRTSLFREKSEHR